MKPSRKLLLWIGSAAFLLYLAVMIYFLFFCEQYGRTSSDGLAHVNLVPFREIRRFWVNRKILGRASYLNLAGNVAAFVPFGLLLPVRRRRVRKAWRVCLAGALMSLGVETVQLLTRVGSFDVDDILLNTAGTLLGYGLYIVLRRVYDASRGQAL